MTGVACSFKNTYSRAHNVIPSIIQQQSGTSGNKRNYLLIFVKPHYGKYFLSPVFDLKNKKKNRDNLDFCRSNLQQYCTFFLKKGFIFLLFLHNTLTNLSARKSTEDGSRPSTQEDGSERVKSAYVCVFRFLPIFFWRLHNFLSQLVLKASGLEGEQMSLMVNCS